MNIADLFKDQQLSERYKQKGFVTVPLLNQQEISYLSEFYTNLEKEAQLDSSFYASVWSENRNYRKALQQAAINTISPKISTYLNDIKPVLGTFQVKKTGTGTHLQAHQDWSFVDEPDYDTALIWCPLIDVNNSNGNLQVIPGSHSLNNYIRGRFFDAPFRSFDDTLLPELLIDVPLGAGDAIIMHTRLIHASPDNLSSQKRIAASMVVAPAPAPLYHWVLEKNKTPLTQKKLAVNSEFFEEYSCFDTVEALTPVDIIPHQNKLFTSKQFLEALNITKQSPKRLGNLFGLLK